MFWGTERQVKVRWTFQLWMWTQKNGGWSSNKWLTSKQGIGKEETQIQSQGQGLLRVSGKCGWKRLGQGRTWSSKGGYPAEPWMGEEMLKAPSWNDGVKNLVVQSLSYVQVFRTTQRVLTHGLHHTRLLCLPLSPRVCSNSCPLSWWCYPTISSSATPFSFCLQSFSSELVLHVRWPQYPQSAIRIFLNTLIELESMYRWWFEQSKIFV